MDMNNFELKVKVLFIKKYFDIGYGLTAPLKWALAILGATIQDVELITRYGIIYIVLCFLAGWLYIRYDLAQAEAEVSNRLNPFMQEVRDKL